MRKPIALLLFLLLLALPLYGQRGQISSSAADRFRVFTTATEPATCNAGRVWLNLTTGLFKGCTAANTIGTFTIGGLTQAQADLRYQPLDTELTAIAGLTSAADRLAYFTGSGTASLAVFTSAGRALVDDADATAQRATLGLVIGTNVQAWDADLDTWAGKTPYAGTLTITTGKTANITNTLTFSGTDGTTMAFPATSATVARTDASNQFTGNQGIGVAASGTAGLLLLAQDNGDNNTVVQVQNTNNTGTLSSGIVKVTGDTASVNFSAHGAGRIASRFGVTIGGYGEVLATAGNGLLIGTSTSTPVRIGTNSAAALVVDTSQNVTMSNGAVTAGTMTVTNSANLRVVTHRFDWTNAMVTALGATTAGDVSVCTLPAKTIVKNAYIVITGAAGTVTTLTVAVGRTSAAYIDYIVASDAKAAANTVYGDASGERGTNLTGYDLPSFTGTTVVNAHFISTGGNLSTVTSSTGTVYIETVTLP